MKRLVPLCLILLQCMVPCTCFIVTSTKTLTTTSEVVSTLPTSPSARVVAVPPPPKLELDAQGNLRLGHQILLNGFRQTVWSTLQPETSNDENNDHDHHQGLFLHTHYVKESAEHAQGLGDLVTCHQLLACA